MKRKYLRTLLLLPLALSFMGCGSYANSDTVLEKQSDSIEIKNTQKVTNNNINLNDYSESLEIKISIDKIAYM